MQNVVSACKPACKSASYCNHGKNAHHSTKTQQKLISRQAVSGRADCAMHRRAASSSSFSTPTSACAAPAFHSPVCCSSGGSLVPDDFNAFPRYATYSLVECTFLMGICTRRDKASADLSDLSSTGAVGHDFASAQSRSNGAHVSEIPSPEAVSSELILSHDYTRSMSSGIDCGSSYCAATYSWNDSEPSSLSDDLPLFDFVQDLESYSPQWPPDHFDRKDYPYSDVCFDTSSYPIQYYPSISSLELRLNCPQWEQSPPSSTPEYITTTNKDTAKCPFPDCTTREGTLFANASHLAEHVRETHLKALVCNEPSCALNKTFSTKADLRRHMLSKHSAKEILCQERGCSARFKRRDKLIDHGRRMHGV